MSRAIVVEGTIHRRSLRLLAIELAGPSSRSAAALDEVCRIVVEESLSPGGRRQALLMVFT